MLSNSALPTKRVCNLKIQSIHSASTCFVCTRAGTPTHSSTALHVNQKAQKGTWGLVLALDTTNEPGRLHTGRAAWNTRDTVTPAPKRQPPVFCLEPGHPGPHLPPARLTKGIACLPFTFTLPLTSLPSIIPTPTKQQPISPFNHFRCLFLCRRPLRTVDQQTHVYANQRLNSTTATEKRGCQPERRRVTIHDSRRIHSRRHKPNPTTRGPCCSDLESFPSKSSRQTHHSTSPINCDRRPSHPKPSVILVAHPR